MNFSNQLSTGRPFFTALCWLAIYALPAGQASDLIVAPYKATGIYELGEPVGWTVTLPETAPPPTGACAYTIKKNNITEIQSGQLGLSSGEAKIEVSLDEPAMVYAEISPPDSEQPIIVAAAVEPQALEPVVPRPADFDDFWRRKVEELQQIPANPVVTPGDSGRQDVDYATIQMDLGGGQHVYGQLAKPKRPGKFPAMVIFQWASPPYPLDKSWVVWRAYDGWLALNIQPHEVLPTEPKEYYEALPEEVKKYELIGNDSRDESYFLQMYLRDYRAVDYLVNHPDWDGKTLVAMGTSMGGQQALCIAGLHPSVTHVIANVPAGCDTNGPLHGRSASYPFFPADSPQVLQTALYFDVVNFAPKIRAKTLVSIGFEDTVSAPAGIWTAFNQIPGPKEAVAMVNSPHNHLAAPEDQQPYTVRSAEWLAALAGGGEVPLRPLTTAQNVSRGMPRADRNSQIAHQQLLQKANQGKIGLYFLGDSITRRWGCTDPQYADLMKSWKDNFFGWNAANFGWGGDTTQNILWRIDNGELDGVNPKVIVLMAGTNDVGWQAGDEAKVEQVTNGMREIIEVCQEKAPDATIILTAIFPRSDVPSVMPTIDAINVRIAKLADGKKVRWLDVNSKLTDADGKLLEGMMGDGLHPAAPGYQVWADGLRPLLTELLGPPALEDHAPPPTGDPSIAGR